MPGFQATLVSACCDLREENTEAGPRVAAPAAMGWPIHDTWERVLGSSPPPRAGPSSTLGCGHSSPFCAGAAGGVAAAP